MNTTNGKIAEQSKASIVKALLDIMEQYNFKEITITQIAQEAKLSRKTFYRLFQDKEEVLACLFEKLYMECLEEIQSHKIIDYWDVVQCYFDFWEKRKSLLVLLKKNNLLATLFEGAYKYSFEIFKKLRAETTVEKYDLPLPYLLAYSVGGIHSMLFVWVQNEMALPSKVVIEQLKNSFETSNRPGMNY